MFLAADQDRPRRLIEDRRINARSRLTYAIGGLALWSPTRDDVTPDTLAAPDIARMAIANPDLAPYGAASLELLDGLDLYEAWEPKLVYGESVGQAFAFVSTGNAEIGFVSAAQVLALPEDARGAYWLVPTQLHEPIAQDAVLLTRGDINPAASAFLTYLYTDEARGIIRDSGYWLP